MNLDLRIPMGLMFTLVGLILTLYGWATRGSLVYLRAGNVDVNLYWGLVLLVFGMGMFLLGRRGERKAREEMRRKPPQIESQGGHRRGH